ncbi:flagellar biosynthesis protein FlgN [Treponema sp. OMZ 840]|uniref:flagellar biosynthesis protein FlgN n=1 Tax=Treponema sp. OMZ 840 TaxID=244313 RepID=UPI003D9207C4
MNTHIDEKELNERVAILRRLKELLIEQRAKFREYLTVLEKQESSIAGEDMEKLLAHTELEQKIIGNISDLQKVIKPMEALYKDIRSENEGDIPVLQADLSKLQSQILLQNEKNRTALRMHINSVRSKIQGLQNPYKKKQSIYASTGQTASLINIHG